VPADAIGEAAFRILKFLVRAALEWIGTGLFEILWDWLCYWTGRVVWVLSWPVRRCFTPVAVYVARPGGSRELTEDGYKVVGLVTWILIGVAMLIWWAGR
jgi:hypothetical protein